MPVSRKEWEARDNARTLADAERIRNNPEKLKEAKVAITHIGRVTQGIMSRVRTIRPNRARGINRKRVDENPFNVFKKI